MFKWKDDLMVKALHGELQMKSKQYYSTDK